MSYRIRKVAILGAGTMGAAIAAHCANAGLEVDLLDIAPDDDDKNAVVEAGLDRMQNARPAALMGDNVAGRIRIGNFEEHFGRVVLQSPRQGLYSLDLYETHATYAPGLTCRGYYMHPTGYPTGYPIRPPVR